MALPTRRETVTLPELFDRTTEWPWRRRFWRPDFWSEDTLMPPVDMFKEDGNIVVKAALPGAKPEEVEATVEENMLTLRRHYEAETEEKEKDYFYKEQRVGSFVRQLQLPEAVDKEHIQAELKDGVLTIKLPVTGPSARETKIQIKG